MKFSQLIYVFITFLYSSLAYSAIVTDGEFTAWSSFSFVTDNPFVAGPPPNVSSGSTVTVTIGGNPGAFLQATHTFTTGDTIWTGGIKTDFTYDPISEGAIGSLSVSADVQMLPIGSSSWQLVVEQGGQRYFSVPWNSFSGSSWANVIATDLKATDFDTNPWAVRAGVSPDGNHPDFGLDANPLQFGFMFGNRVIGNGTLTNTLGLDNFSVQIAPIPLPAAVWLYISGLMTLFGIRKNKIGLFIPKA